MRIWLAFPIRMLSVERWLKDQFDCRWFADYRDMLSEVEAVCIAVPTLLHHAVGLACLEAGLHVLIEKPIAASQEEAASLSESASRVDRLLQVGHIERFNPAFVN
jgi:predicted dehydrogenase